MTKKSKKIIAVITVLIIVLFAGNILSKQAKVFFRNLKKNSYKKSIELNRDKLDSARIKLNINGKREKSLLYPLYIDRNEEVLIAVNEVNNLFDVAAYMISDTEISIDYRGKKYIGTSKKNEENSKEFEKVDIKKKAGRFYVNLKSIVKILSGDYTFDKKSKTVSLKNIKTVEDYSFLPPYYNQRNNGRKTETKDQGEDPTCWSVATATTLETDILPYNNLKISSDHIVNKNSFGILASDGGNSYMAKAYLAAWQGPVSKEDDPYDGYSPDGLLPKLHVQEFKNIENHNRNEIKKNIYKYGAVQCSMYLDMENLNVSSPFYNYDTFGYCYKGENVVNHAITIIGWDDNYPKENFPIEVQTNGAYICQNTWGPEFGDDGIFYVSYEDDKIGDSPVAYSNIEESGNYDKIYQSDYCGEIGVIEYNNDEAWMANVFNSQSGNEILKAVGLYTTHKDTEYEIYIKTDYKDTKDLSRGIKVASGKIKDIGYYTIPSILPIDIKKPGEFAIIAKIKTKGHKCNLAIEYNGSNASDAVRIDDGKGYAGPTNNYWSSIEENEQSNICFKAYTTIKK